MKTTIKTIAAITILACIYLCLSIEACNTSESVPNNATAVQATSQTKLPQDVFDTCSVSPQLFDSWFVSGKATENGMVKNANSVDLIHNSNCDFYKWSEQMFLWTTSTDTIKSGKTVLESPLFYDVLPEDSSFQRQLVAHNDNHVFQMGSHLVKNGPNRLPVIRSKSGKLYEIEKTVIVGKNATVKDATGNLQNISKIEKGSNGLLAFVNTAGKPIQGPKINITHTLNRQRIVHEFITPNKHIFLDINGSEVDAEEGQATGNVLMAQNGSLVYYLTMVNDVYAYYLSASKTGHISNNQFPITHGAMDSVCAIAKANGKILPDSNALAIEIKSSWVEAATLPAGKYITVMASIPTYKKTDSIWVPIGEQTVKMALIGMHIVGSVAGHAEMVWATFEHNNNAPNAAFDYLDKKKNKVSMPPEKGTGWLLSNNTTDTGYNISRMVSNTVGPAGSFTLTGSGDTIKAQKNPATNKYYSMTASNTNRAMPWGSAKDSITNQEDKSSAASNSEVISVNNAIQSLLVGNDIRKNYLFMGATWTFGGSAPNGSSYSNPKDSLHVAIGTSVLANSTMETDFQAPTTSCFFCHSGNESVTPDNLSHIYPTLQPLSLKYYWASKK